MEKTKKAILVLLNLAEEVQESVVDDGKVDWQEAIRIGGKTLGLIGVIKTLPAIKEELKTINEQGVTEILELVKAEVDLANDDLETKIEAALEVLAQLVIMVFLKPQN